MLNYLHLSAQGTKNSGASGSQAELWTVNVNTAAAGAILTIYDGPAASGVVVAVIDCSFGRSLCYGTRCHNGVYGVLSVADCDVTIGVK